MSTASTSIRSPRALAWHRRGAAFADFCRQFTHHRAGMVGLIFLVIVAAVAILAPVIAPSSMLDVTKLVDPERFAPPSWQHPLVTDQLGRVIWVRMVWVASVSLLF